MLTVWNQIVDHIRQATGTAFEMSDRCSIGGGSVNQAYRLIDESSNQAQSYFVKLNDAGRMSMFEAEALGLGEMADTSTIKVPRPVCWGMAETSSYIVLEWLNLGRGGTASWQSMGHHLAAMHKVSSPHGFGWDQNNTIGFIPQVNPWADDWVTFFRDQRLGYQFKLARRRGGHFPQQDELLQTVSKLLTNHHPQSSLVHGDLWSGNAAVTQDGEPIIFDPATYYGDREVDLAMSELFGRFPREFYRAYDEAFPIDPGYAKRVPLYNLYHILNHFNQFGGGYESQANSMIRRLLS